MMKRLYLIIIAIILGFVMPAVVLAGQTSAIDAISGCTTNGNLAGTDICKDYKQGQGSKQDPIISDVKVAIQVLSLIIGAAAVIGVVVSGLKMITSNGDSGSVATARSALTYSLIGIAVAVLSQLIVVFILDKLNL